MILMRFYNVNDYAKYCLKNVSLLVYVNST
uniref:Uncharacterized protein n=1 Tax=Anguilla anguilla TaxID=7936 RepID=A0A0E9VVM4_ANGAN